MSTRIPLKSGVALLTLLLWLGGCALSPQQVLLRPFIDVPADLPGNGRSIKVTVTDDRQQPAFGHRGGVYNTAEITPRGDVAQAVFRALAERLQASRFTVINGAATGELTATAPAELELAVQVRQLDYLTRNDLLVGGPLLNEIRLTALLTATARTAGASRSGRYQANSVLRRLGHPSAAENEEMINEVLSQALKQLLLDGQLRAMLAS